MNNKKFEILLKVINVLSVITLEKYWKNGITLAFKKECTRSIQQPGNFSKSINQRLETTTS
jgi:hypothetical protein